MRVNDLTGQKFGALTIVAKGVTAPGGKAQWICQCDCGESVVARGDNLRNGRTRSCGKCGLGGQYGAQARADIPMSYRILVYTGPDMFKDRPYSFGIVLDANGKRVAKTSEPIARVGIKQEGHAAAARCMKILQAQELVNPQNNRTWRRWLTEERVVQEIVGTYGTCEEVDAKWEEVTGQVLPKSSGLAAIQQPRTIVETPEEIADGIERAAGLARLFKEFDIDTD